MFKATEVERKIREINLLINILMTIISCCLPSNCYITYCIYPPEIVQTNLLGRLQKKSMEHNNCLYGAYLLQWRVRKLPNGNIPSPQNYFQTNC